MSISRPADSPPRSAAWKAVAACREALRGRSTADLFAGPAARFPQFSASGAGLLLDFTRQHLDRDALAALLALAAYADVPGAAAAMFRGDAINPTESRAALHTALRQPPGARIGGAAIEQAVLAERTRMLGFAADVREGRACGSSGQRFETVINIGIGGSDLGPAMAVEALRNFTQGGPLVRFVSNVDGCALHDSLETCDPERTLFIIASKTFSTQETMANARTARAWIERRLGADAIPAHFVAVSVNTAAMNQFGVHPDYRFVMWDWVGGRYSLWSSIGVSLAIAIGPVYFEALLAGAHELDVHFRDEPPGRNLPVLAALLGIWNINFLQLPTHAVLPYDSRLARLPAYLQQLEMESNGKSVDVHGQPVDWETAAVLWGAPGNNAQHSFFQLLHQGTPRAAMDFILPLESSCGDASHHELAVANCLAQAEALMFGEASGPDVPAYKGHAGGRPSTLILFDRLDPRNLGALLALYEHKVYVQSVLWGINAFDQWGVELGKKVADRVLAALRAGSVAGVSPSLAGTLEAMRVRRS